VKIGMAIEELHRSENELAVELLQVSSRHKAEHEIFHIGRDLARWSQQHVRELAEAGQDYGLDLETEPREATTVASAVREKGAEILGRRREPALLLLGDLRRVYQMASGTSLDWEVLAQAARAARAGQLLDLTKRCHPETLRQARWAKAMLTEVAAQALVS
jgi:hypothetical protein